MYKRSQKLKELRKVMEGGVQEEYQACIGIVSQKQLEVWSKLDPRIGRYRKALRAKCGNKRNLMVVDSLFKQAIGGNPTCIAIYLKFKMGWKDNALVDQSYHQTMILQIDKANDNEIKTSRKTMAGV